MDGNQFALTTTGTLLPTAGSAARMGTPAPWAVLAQAPVAGVDAVRPRIAKHVPGDHPRSKPV
jgi:hypothetical protein